MGAISRKDFLKGAAIGAAGVVAQSTPGLTTLARAAEATGGADADLIVVGAGLAGLTIAGEAASLGAKVLLLDKEPEVGGTARVGGGSFSAANSKAQLEKGIEDSPAQHYADCQKIGAFKADSDLLQLYVENAAATADWLGSMGVKYRGPMLDPSHEFYSVARTLAAENGARGFLKPLTERVQTAIDRGDVTLKTGTRVVGLVKGGSGVTGVRALGADGNETTYSGIVMLASGGYGSNPEIVKKYSPKYSNLLPITPLHATGECILMAEAAGAQLVNMQYVVPYLGGMEDPKQPGRTDWGWIVSRIYRMLKGDLWVDPSGRRFINEDTDSADARERALRKIDNVCYIVFNEALLQAGGEKLVARVMEQMQSGNSIFKADTIPALAAASGIDAAGLAKTLAAYNQNAKQGKDPEHKRTDIVPIETGPYYAIKTTGVLFTTMGGVRANVNLQALDGDGRVIPGLYAVGEVMGMGQTMGDGLCGGFGNGVCITFGRLAARHAVAQARVCTGMAAAT